MSAVPMTSLQGRGSATWPRAERALSSRAELAPPLMPAQHLRQRRTRAGQRLSSAGAVTGGGYRECAADGASSRGNRRFFFVLCEAADHSSSSSSSGSSSGTPYPAPESWWLRNERAVRAAPLVTGALGGAALVLNRAFSGVAPVADAGSAQSRADVLGLALAATLVLTGLAWKSVQPKAPTTVELDGDDCLATHPALPPGASDELRWAWDALRESTRCRSLVVLYRGRCALQAGRAARGAAGLASGGGRGRAAAEEEEGPPPPPVRETLEGAVCRSVLESGRASYMANLALFPGRAELGFLPANAQAAIVQPLGEDGVLVAASDTVRGFGPLDQAWINTIAQKLDSTLQDWVP